MTREDEAITQPDLVLGEEERLQALDLWLEHIEIPAILIPLLEGVVLGHHHGDLAAYLGAELQELPLWERCFARWAEQTVYQAAADILDAARR
ncbi:MAG: hypothetical protein VYE22_20830 [Myxococcota bacterium]|nr:hypothetical protein [Myxococcota bacterium]